MSIISYKRTIAAVFVLAIALPLLGGCASDDKDNYKERPVEELYNDAMDLLKDESYDKAAKAFDEVERQHPYSVWATRAQMMEAYADYQNLDYDEAIKRENTDYMAAVIPGAYEMILPGVSHFAFLQDPAMFDYAVERFLE